MFLLTSSQKSSSLLFGGQSAKAVERFVVRNLLSSMMAKAWAYLSSCLCLAELRPSRALEMSFLEVRSATNCFLDSPSSLGFASLASKTLPIFVACTQRVMAEVMKATTAISGNIIHNPQPEHRTNPIEFVCTWFTCSYQDHLMSLDFCFSNTRHSRTRRLLPSNRIELRLFFSPYGSCACFLSVISSWLRIERHEFFSHEWAIADLRICSATLVN